MVTGAFGNIPILINYVNINNIIIMTTVYPVNGGHGETAVPTDGDRDD